ncbi:hypothetical protein AA12717_2535 [Gluconacetobacter sacchari DSM 12717]|uniref:Uncharacterized protein n=2 Tax=Gluconacetobacter sacchari TaxID=92759 RepID=A0A7W4NLF8_9PROT|nr:hypothetical protein [Gluconacetobacter sacchari]MBB2159912.1 hypothetical protein [Gluconacetobacter sacchari]GBQ27019.1 hypothetical protein AA12717_2535 [Gluconacetobacter sacchari DSM 12717]
MSHNYATPMTPERRLARLLSRIPDDRVVRLERVPGHTHAPRWRAAIGDAGGATCPEARWSAPFDTMADALDAAWKAVRPPAEPTRGA